MEAGGTDNKKSGVCAVCNKGFILTGTEARGPDFLREHHLIGYDNEREMSDASLFRDRTICIDCIRILVRTDLRRLLSVPSRRLTPGEDDGLPNPAEADPERTVKELSDLLGNPTLRLDSMKGPGEVLLSRRLPHIREHLDVLYESYPGIESSDFFRMEMNLLFEAGKGFFGQLPETGFDPETDGIPRVTGSKLSGRLNLG